MCSKDNSFINIAYLLCVTNVFSLVSSAEIKFTNSNLNVSTDTEGALLEDNFSHGLRKKKSLICM